MTSSSSSKGFTYKTTWKHRASKSVVWEYPRHHYSWWPKPGNTSDCPSTGEWRNKLWHSHLVQQYKRNKLQTHTTALRNLKNILLSERSQMQKGPYCIISFLSSRIGKKLTYSVEIRTVVASGDGDMVWEGDIREFSGIMDSLSVYRDVGYLTRYL